MAPINPRLLVKSMTERRAKILFAFLFAGHAMDVKELEMWTGIPRNGYYTDLSALCAEGLLAESSQRMANGRKVWLLGADVLPLLRDLSGLLSGGKYLEDATPLLEDGQMSPKQTTGANRALLVAQIPEIQYQEVGVTFEKNLAACRKYHIGEPNATKISLLEWSSPEFIRAHVDDLDPSDTIGLAVIRIIGNEIPRSWEEEAREIAEKSSPGPHRSVLNADENIDDEDDCDEDESTLAHTCLWQDELDEVWSVGPLAGQHKRGLRCGEPIAEGSWKWCDKHLQIGIDTYGE